MKKLKTAIAVMMLMMIVMFATECTPEEHNDAEMKVTTYTPHDITSTTAVCGGEVYVSQGLTLSELGVCWGTNPNPTVEDSHLSTSDWSVPYVCTIMGLVPGTTYHVRAYTLSDLEYYFGEDKSFTTGGGGGSLNGHDYVDLGLPSGTLWATCNVGAETPEEYGDYFAWGETEPKTTYAWSTYQYSNGSYDQLTKYCNDSDYGYNGFTDTLTILLPVDDAATANWGTEWCMPTMEEWQELWFNTTSTWTTRNDVNGRLFTSRNGESLFLPASGNFWFGGLSNVGDNGQYWSGSLCSDRPDCAWMFSVDSDGCGNGYSSRGGFGQSIRPVCSSRQK